MSIRQLEVLSALQSEEIGSLIRVWTADSIYRSSPKRQIAQVKAAQLLQKVPGQKFPPVVYRLLEIDTSKLTSWKKLADKLEAKWPEACSGDLKGLKSFLKDAAGGHHKLDVSGFLLFSIKVAPSDCMFSILELSKHLSVDDLNRKDDAGFPIKVYAKQNEVVVKPGTLKKALQAGNVSLIGHKAPRAKATTWLSKPKSISATS